MKLRFHPLAFFGLLLIAGCPQCAEHSGIVTGYVDFLRSASKDQNSVSVFSSAGSLCALRVVEDGNIVELYNYDDFESYVPKPVGDERPCRATLPLEQGNHFEKFRYFGQAYFSLDGGSSSLREEQVSLDLVQRDGMYLPPIGFNPAFQVYCEAWEDVVHCGGGIPESTDAGNSD